MGPGNSDYIKHCSFQHLVWVMKVAVSEHTVSHTIKVVQGEVVCQTIAVAALHAEI